MQSLCAFVISFTVGYSNLEPYAANFFVTFIAIVRYVLLSLFFLGFRSVSSSSRMVFLFCHYRSGYSIFSNHLHLFLSFVPARVFS